MTTSLEKFAIIAYIAKAVEGKGTLGKKALQKLVHLTSELRHVSVGYKFTLYTYGPFSRELAGDVDLLASMGLISMQFNPLRNGYEIKPNSDTHEVIEKNGSLDLEVTQGIDFIVNNFGGRLAKELELSSMIVFILKNNLTDTEDDNLVVDKFLEIKPHYEREDVVAGLKEIRALLVN